MAFGVNPITGRPGPAPKRSRDGDKLQARQKINSLVFSGQLPKPNDLPCVDCGHVYKKDGTRHEYDHYLGYGSENHLKVEAVCKRCHVVRDNKKFHQTHCKQGHEFTTENTYRKKNGNRMCVQCRRRWDRGRRDAAWWRAWRIKRKLKNVKI